MKLRHDWFATETGRPLQGGRAAAAVANRRRSERVALTLLGRLQTLHGTRTVRLQDVSRWGAMVEGAPVSIRVGSEAILKCHQLDVFATVLWVEDGRCGIRFDMPVQDAGIEALQAMSEHLAEAGGEAWPPE